MEFTRKFVYLFTQNSDDKQISKIAIKRFWQLLNELPQDMSKFSDSENIIQQVLILIKYSHEKGGKAKVIDWFQNVFLLLTDENQTWFLDELIQTDKKLYDRFV